MDILTKSLHGESRLINGEHSDPVFLKTKHLLIKPPPHYSSKTISNRLAHQITRSPKDLRSHTQRIFVFITERNEAALYSSLIDLFLVLGNKGLSLRKIMLLNSRDILAKKQFEFLQQRLHTGLDSEQSIPNSNQSILSSGRKNKNIFIKKCSSNHTDGISTLEQVQSYLEYGQLDEARELLQESILTNPLQLEHHQELIGIFKNLEDSVLFNSFYQKLLKLEMPLPLAWEELAAKYNYEGNQT